MLSKDDSVATRDSAGGCGEGTNPCGKPDAPVKVTATLVDNGEPGNADTFSISLSSGYNASGTLVGGNVQVHTPH